MRQYDHDSSRAPVLIITHSTSLKAVTEAITELPKTGVISSDPVILRIEEWRLYKYYIVFKNFITYYWSTKIHYL